ncbi:MAG: OmpA family protein [Desulfobacteraceae bacterium]|nr:MAG: OmpA family protein [Desulfobacteraceae bacterium]
MPNRKKGSYKRLGFLYDSKQDSNANNWTNFLAPFADMNIKTNRSYDIFYTDNVGGFDFNLNLSKRRADAVVAALSKDYGINAARLTANGVAYLAPIAVNTTEEGRAKNRRVELVPR